MEHSHALKLAGLPALKTLEQFDFAFQLLLEQEKIHDLNTLRFMANGHNVILSGRQAAAKRTWARGLETRQSPQVNS